MSSKNLFIFFSFPQITQLLENITAVQNIRLYSWLRQERPPDFLNSKEELSKLLMQGFQKEVEKIEMLVYRAERAIDDLKEYLKKTSHHLISTQLKNMVVIPDHVQKILVFQKKKITIYI